MYQRGGLVFAISFNPQDSIPDYKFRAPLMGQYRLILNSDDGVFGGFGRIDGEMTYFSRPKPNA